MNNIETMKLALEALEFNVGEIGFTEVEKKALTALRQAIKQPKVRTGNCLRVGVCASEGHKIAPPRQPLTDEQLKEIWLNGKDHGDDWLDVQGIARAVEAAHGIKA